MRLFFLFPIVFVAALAQSSSSSSSSPSLSLSLTTGSVTVTLATTVDNQPTQIVSVLPGIVRNVTYTITPSIAAPLPSISSTPLPSSTSDPYALDTVVDPAFAVLGVILILTGLPSAFWGHKNRWTSFFLIGFFTLSLVCIVLIFKFGVIPAIHPPSNTVRGMFVLSCVIAGVAGGAISIFFWKGARYCIGAWGGFAFALWIQCFRNGGLIRPIGFRWILYIGCGVLGFTLATIPKIHFHVLLVSTAIVGATSFILGVDCFTTAGLKEFYIWNLGFPSLFPKYTDNGIQFPVTQQMQIELGLIAAVALMGIAVQLRILKTLQQKVQEIAEETKHLDEEAEIKAAERFSSVVKEREAWETDHPGLGRHERNESNLSTLPLLKRHDSPPSEIYSDETRQRHLSGLSEFRSAPTSDEDLKRASRHGQGLGALPTLDLGMGIQEEVPSNYITQDIKATASELKDLKRKQELLSEIQNLRRSIDILKTETPIPSSSEESRRPSVVSGRRFSLDAGTALLPAHPVRESDPRGRAHSMELSSLTAAHHETISRPSSAPLKDDGWERYIQERKLLQPPSGVTSPIRTASWTPTPRLSVSPAVQEALQRRKRRESALAGSSGSSEDVPLVRFVQQQMRGNNNGAVAILPPRRSSVTIMAESQQAVRTRTFEELNERHKEKLRDLQAPLTQLEKEQAELDAARRRWERSKTLEKEAVTRRQAEKAAALEKRKKAGTPEVDNVGGRKGSQETRRHSRSLSLDVLGGPGMNSSRRVSVMKVEDWQRYQQEGQGLKQDSGTGGVPFPDPRRKSREVLS